MAKGVWMAVKHLVQQDGLLGNSRTKLSPTMTGSQRRRGNSASRGPGGVVKCLLRDAGQAIMSSELRAAQRVSFTFRHEVQYEREGFDNRHL